MKTLKQAFLIAALTITSISLTAGNTALAHVTVKPAEVTTASRQIFTVSVPNEKDIATTSVKLLVPSTLESVTPTAKAGWTISTEKSGSGEKSTVTSITWSNGAIDADLRDDFTFSGKAPSQTGELKWKAYQTYADGTVVAWDKEATDNEEEAPNSGPLSVTKITESAIDETSTSPSAAATNAQNSSDRGFYTGIAGIATGLIALFFATRRK